MRASFCDQQGLAEIVYNPLSQKDVRYAGQPRDEPGRPLC